MAADSAEPLGIPAVPQGVFEDGKWTVFTNMYYPPSKRVVVALQLMDYPYIEVEVSPFSPPDWMEVSVWQYVPVQRYPCARTPRSEAGGPWFIAGTMEILNHLNQETGQLPLPQDERGRGSLGTLLLSLGAMHCYTLRLMMHIIRHGSRGAPYSYLRTRLWRWVQIVNDTLLSADGGSGGPAFGGVHTIGIAEVAGVAYTGPLHVHGREFSLEPPLAPEYMRYHRWRMHAMANPHIWHSVQLIEQLRHDNQFLADYRRLM